MNRRKNQGPFWATRVSFSALLLFMFFLVCLISFSSSSKKSAKNYPIYDEMENDSDYDIKKAKIHKIHGQKYNNSRKKTKVVRKLRKNRDKKKPKNKKKRNLRKKKSHLPHFVKRSHNPKPFFLSKSIDSESIKENFNSTFKFQENEILKGASVQWTPELDIERIFTAITSDAERVVKGVKENPLSMWAIAGSTGMVMGFFFFFFGMIFLVGACASWGLLFCKDFKRQRVRQRRQWLEQNSMDWEYKQQQANGQKNKKKVQDKFSPFDIPDYKDEENPKDDRNYTTGESEDDLLKRDLVQVIRVTPTQTSVSFSAYPELEKRIIETKHFLQEEQDKKSNQGPFFYNNFGNFFHFDMLLFIFVEFEKKKINSF